MSDDTRTDHDTPTENAVLNHEDLNQTETIESGMQGATGNADANGLDPDVELGERVEELRENLRPLTGQK